MEDRSVYNYKDIIYSCFQPEESLSEHCLPHHALIYVYSGEININDDGAEHTVHAGVINNNIENFMKVSEL